MAEKDSLPAVFNAVGTMKNEKQVKAAYNEFVAILKTCQRVCLADEGVSLELTVSSNHDKTHKNVDRQVNVAALGTASKDGDSVPFGVWLSWMSLDNNITLVGYANVNENKKSNRSLNAHAYTAFAKLQAVMEGKPLPSRALPRDGPRAIGRRRRGVLCRHDGGRACSAVTSGGRACSADMSGGRAHGRGHPVSR